MSADYRFSQLVAFSATLQWVKVKLDIDCGMFPKFVNESWLRKMTHNNQCADRGQG